MELGIWLAAWADPEWERVASLWLEVEVLAEPMVEASCVFLEQVVEQEDLGWGSESRLMEQVKVEAEGEGQVSA